jgi:hypothetical protein
MISCIERTNEKKVANKRKEKQFTNEAIFEFPDTIYKNKTYKGEIKYSGILDTITTDVMHDKKGIQRYITYSFITSNNSNYTLKELRKMNLDTVGAVDNHTIPFYDIKFEKIGTYYIHGIINDHAFIDTNKVSNPKNKVRYIENEAQVRYKIVVIDK